MLEAQKSGQPGERALSLPATLQRLVAASCSFQTVALIALELSSKAQQHRSEISPKAASDDASPPDSAADAATAKALQAASEAVAGVLVGALEAFSESRESAAGVHQAREQASDASVWAVQAVLSCLEGSADGRQPALPWSQDDFRSTLSTSRDEVWTKMADAMLAAAAAQSSSSSIDPVAYALLDAMASIAPIHSIPASTRSALISRAVFPFIIYLLLHASLHGHRVLPLALVSVPLPLTLSQDSLMHAGGPAGTQSSPCQHSSAVSCCTAQPAARLRPTSRRAVPSRRTQPAPPLPGRYSVACSARRARPRSSGRWRRCSMRSGTAAMLLTRCHSSSRKSSRRVCLPCNPLGRIGSLTIRTHPAALLILAQLGCSLWILQRLVSSPAILRTVRQARPLQKSPDGRQQPHSRMLLTAGMKQTSFSLLGSQQSLQRM